MMIRCPHCRSTGTICNGIIQRDGVECTTKHICSSCNKIFLMEYVFNKYLNEDGDNME